MGLTESLFQKFQSGAIMADPGRYSGKARKGTTFTPGQKLSLIRHVLSIASPKNICRPVNANGSVGGQNNSLLHRRYGAVFSPVSALSVISPIIF